VSVLRLRQRRLFYRSRLFRELAAAAAWPRRRTTAPDLVHLAFYDEITWGPVQRDEALFLHALVRAVRPEVVLEIGFLHGDSAFNFLRAMDADARLYSFDVDPACAAVASERLGHDPRFVFRTRSQDALTREDIDGRLADFVFLDAAHDLGLNEATFERLLELTAPEAILAIHDTGAIPRALVPAGHWTLGVTERWAGDDYEHQPDERAFVNRLLERHPEFSQVHVHSRRAFRHGLTLVQRSRRLARPRTP